jgi:ribonuclease J
MRDLIRDHPERRFIVASFASHLHRVEQVAREAVAAGRRVAFLGRSMTQNVTLAREMGILDLPTDRIIDVEEVARYAPGEVCVICTGSQGEPMSALALMASHEHKYIKVSNDDIVVLSAHAIPGNEPNVSRVIDGLHRAGALVIHDSISPVHVSGHASREELKFVLGLVQPEWFVPVHGEYRHLVHHAALAADMGLEPDHILVCEDGDAVTIEDTTVDVDRRAVPAGYQYVDGIGDDISRGVLRDRRTLGEEGFVVVIVTVDAGTGEIVTGPEIVTRGWVYEAEADALLEDAKTAVRDALTHAAAQGPVEYEALRRHARRALGKLINERTRRRPAVIPVILEV